MFQSFWGAVARYVPYSGVVLKEQVFFLLFILITVFSMDMLKSYFAGKIKKFSPRSFFL